MNSDKRLSPDQIQEQKNEKDEKKTMRGSEPARTYLSGYGLAEQSDDWPRPIECFPGCSDQPASRDASQGQ